MLNGNHICGLLQEENNSKRVFSSGNNDEKIIDFFLINYFYSKVCASDRKKIDCYIIDKYGQQ